MHGIGFSVQGSGVSIQGSGFTVCVIDQQPSGVQAFTGQ